MVWDVDAEIPLQVCSSVSGLVESLGVWGMDAEVPLQFMSFYCGWSVGWLHGWLVGWLGWGLVWDVDAEFLHVGWLVGWMWVPRFLSRLVRWVGWCAVCGVYCFLRIYCFFMFFRLFVCLCVGCSCFALFGFCVLCFCIWIVFRFLEVGLFLLILFFLFVFFCPCLLFALVVFSKKYYLFIFSLFHLAALVSVSNMMQVSSKAMAVGRLFSLQYDASSAFLLATAGSKGHVALWHSDEDEAISARYRALTPLLLPIFCCCRFVLGGLVLRAVC